LPFASTLIVPSAVMPFGGALGWLPLTLGGFTRSPGDR
jgi:hypothetical protein